MRESLLLSLGSRWLERCYCRPPAPVFGRFCNTFISPGLSRRRFRAAAERVKRRLIEGVDEQQWLVNIHMFAHFLDLLKSRRRNRLRHQLFDGWPSNTDARPIACASIFLIVPLFLWVADDFFHASILQSRCQF